MAAISYAMHYSRSHDAVIRVYDAVGNLIETHEHKGDFKGVPKVQQPDDCRYDCFPARGTHAREPMNGSRQRSARQSQ
jgi:hypothetical protein